MNQKLVYRLYTEDGLTLKVRVRNAAREHFDGKGGPPRPQRTSGGRWTSSTIAR